MSTYLNISDKIGLQSTPNPSLLNLYGGAAAAYSLRQLDYTYTGPAVTVRRNSDNTTKDIGFVNGELDTASLEAFTTEDYVRISSDYSGATPYPGAARNGLTVESNQSALGVNEALKCTVTGTNPYFYSSGFGGAGIELNISFDYYIPSGQSLGSIRVGVASPEQNFDTTGEWATANFNQTSSYSFVIFRGNANVIGDEFYIKNLVVTQTSADGFVTTWYDQSGNANNATQATASSQPKIVSLGSTILENGKAAAQFDGSNDGMEMNTTFNLSNISTSFVFSADTGNDDVLYEISQNSSNFLSFGTGNAGTQDAYGTRFRISGADYSVGESGVSGQKLAFHIGNQSATSIDLYLNNTEATGTQTSRAGALGDSTFGYRNSGANAANAKIQEFVIYELDQTSNRAGIETNINDFYSIY